MRALAPAWRQGTWCWLQTPGIERGGCKGGVAHRTISTARVTAPSGPSDVALEELVSGAVAGPALVFPAGTTLGFGVWGLRFRVQGLGFRV